MKSNCFNPHEYAYLLGQKFYLSYMTDGANAMSVLEEYDPDIHEMVKGTIADPSLDNSIVTWERFWGFIYGAPVPSSLVGVE